MNLSVRQVVVKMIRQPSLVTSFLAFDPRAKFGNSFGNNGENNKSSNIRVLANSPSFVSSSFNRHKRVDVVLSKGVKYSITIATSPT